MAMAAWHQAAPPVALSMTLSTDHPYLCALSICLSLPVCSNGFCVIDSWDWEIDPANSPILIRNVDPAQIRHEQAPALPNVMLETHHECLPWWLLLHNETIRIKYDYQQLKNKSTAIRLRSCLQIEHTNVSGESEKLPNRKFNRQQWKKTLKI